MEQKKKPPKRFAVTYTFPEMPGGRMYQSTIVEATNLGMAAHKGFQSIKSRPEMKGRRLSTAKVTIATVNTNRILEE